VVAESNRVIKVSQWLVSGKGCEERRVEAAYDQECVVGYQKRRGYEGETQTDRLLQLLSGQKRRPSHWRRFGRK